MSELDAPVPALDADVFLPGVTVGVVTGTADPRELGRVRVRFPTPSGILESTWAPVMRPLTRPDHGPQLPPEVGDTVVLAFEQGDVNHPLVLGCLRSAAG